MKVPRHTYAYTCTHTHTHAQESECRQLSSGQAGVTLNLLHSALVSLAQKRDFSKLPETLTMDANRLQVHICTHAVYLTDPEPSIAMHLLFCV
jgi:hypothetical protein